MALQDGGPASQSTLSRRTGIYSSDLVGVINELADGGYLERAPDPADRRRNVITMTRRAAATFAGSTNCSRRCPRPNASSSSAS